MVNSFKQFISENTFFHNQINTRLFVVVVLLNIIVWFLWIFKIENLGYLTYLPTEIPLKSWRVYTLPIVGSFFCLINFVLAYVATQKEVLISFYLLSASILIEILILVLIRHYIIIAG